MKTRWLERRIARPGPFLCLCLTEAEHSAALKHLGSKEVPRWVNHGANATVHFHVNEDGKTVAIVCMDDWQGRDPIEVAGMLVHESVHIWQEYCRDTGEKNPGDEQEAYAVQIVAQELMAEFARRMA